MTLDDPTPRIELDLERSEIAHRSTLPSIPPAMPPVFVAEPPPEVPTPESLPGRVWNSPIFSWGLVALGFSLYYLLPAPSLIRQLIALGHGVTFSAIAVLAYLLAITVVPIVGLWRLSPVVNLPRPLALLYLVLPLITVAIYVARTVINVLLPDPF